MFPFLAAAGCIGDETLRAYGGKGQVWALQEIDETTVSASTTLSFDRRSSVSGVLPCNQLVAQLRSPYPWFELEQLATTRRVCPALAEETTILEALQQMQVVEIKGRVMILSNDAGREMVFTAAD